LYGDIKKCKANTKSQKNLMFKTGMPKMLPNVK